MTTIVSPSLAQADAAVSSGTRILTHSDAESTNDIEIVMATITPAESLSWAETWSWSAPMLAEDGTVKTQVKTTQDGIRNFYLSNRTRYNITSLDAPNLRICRDWYALIESQAHFASVPDAVQYEQRWVLFSPMDGSTGITGEIAWGLFPQLAPDESVTEDDRVALYYTYVDALGRQDVDALMTLHAPGVQAAVRDYSGDEVFPYLDGAPALRSYYERLFATVRVRAVDTVQHLDRGWYLFTELRWQVEYIAGPNVGQSGTLLTAEIIPLDSTGRIYAHMGFGTQLLT